MKFQLSKDGQEIKYLMATLTCLKNEHAGLASTPLANFHVLNEKN